MTTVPWVPARRPADSPTYVFVDGYNLLNSMFDCFGKRRRPNPYQFKLPPLADFLCARAGLPPTAEGTISFFIGRIDDTLPTEERNYWRGKMSQMHQANVETPRTPRTVPVPRFKCEECDHTVALCENETCQTRLQGYRRVEKGVDTTLVIAALRSAILYDATNFLFFTKDGDFAPLVDTLKAGVLHRSEYEYRVYSAFPTCDNTNVEHIKTHKGIPNARGLPFTYDDYAQAIG